jgi:hypothetical protein
MRSFRRILVLAALVALIALVRDRLLAADEARTGFGRDVPGP